MASTTTRLSSASAARIHSGTCVIWPVRSRCSAWAAKWFLKSFEDAKKWGKAWYFGTENIDTFYIVKASIPSNVAKTMFHAKNIDYIGDGVSIYEEFLDQLKPLNSWKIKRQKK